MKRLNGQIPDQFCLWIQSSALLAILVKVKCGEVDVGKKLNDILSVHQGNLEEVVFAFLDDIHERNGIIILRFLLGKEQGMQFALNHQRFLCIVKDFRYGFQGVDRIQGGFSDINHVIVLVNESRVDIVLYPRYCRALAFSPFEITLNRILGILWIDSMREVHRFVHGDFPVLTRRQLEQLLLKIGQRLIYDFVHKSIQADTLPLKMLMTAETSVGREGVESILGCPTIIGRDDEVILVQERVVTGFLFIVIKNSDNATFQGSQHIPFQTDMVVVHLVRACPLDSFRVRFQVFLHQRKLLVGPFLSMGESFDIRLKADREGFIAEKLAKLTHMALVERDASVTKTVRISTDVIFPLRILVREAIQEE